MFTKGLEDVSSATVLGEELDGFEPLDVVGVVEHVANHCGALVHLERIASKHNLLQNDSIRIHTRRIRAWVLILNTTTVMWGLPKERACRNEACSSASFGVCSAAAHENTGGRESNGRKNSRHRRTTLWEKKRASNENTLTPLERCSFYFFSICFLSLFCYPVRIVRICAYRRWRCAASRAAERDTAGSRRGTPSPLSSERRRCNLRAE